MSSTSTTASSKQRFSDNLPAYSPEKPNEHSEEEYYQIPSQESSQTTTNYRQDNYAECSYSQPPSPYSTYQQPPAVSQSMPNNYQYNTRRGPIGNIINLAASKVIGSSSNASQQSTSSSSRTALGFVDGFFSGHMQRRERKDYEKEMEHERKHYEKEMKNERKAMRKYGGMLNRQPYMQQEQYAQQQPVMQQQQYAQQQPVVQQQQYAQQQPVVQQQQYAQQQPVMQQQPFVQQPYMQQPYMQQPYAQQPIVIQQQQRSHILGDVLLAEAIL